MLEGSRAGLRLCDTSRAIFLRFAKGQVLRAMARVRVPERLLLETQKHTGLSTDSYDWQKMHIVQLEEEGEVCWAPLQ
jgi:TolB-like protein